MPYAVTIGSGHSAITVRFPTAAQAMAEARNQIEMNARDVKIRISASGEVFTLDEFKARMARGPGAAPIR